MMWARVRAVVLISMLLAAQEASAQWMFTNGSGSPAVTTLYFQDFEDASSNCTAEDPAMDSGGNCDYTTSPISGSESLELEDGWRHDSAWTSISGSSEEFIVFYLDNRGGSEENQEIFRARSGSSDTSPNLYFGLRDDSADTYRVELWCDQTFGPTSILNSGTLNENTIYQIKIGWTEDTGVGRLFVCTGAVGASCTTLVGSCDGTDNQGNMDGYRSDFFFGAGIEVLDDLGIYDGDPTP